MSLFVSVYLCVYIHICVYAHTVASLGAGADGSWEGGTPQPSSPLQLREALIQSSVHFLLLKLDSKRVLCEILRVWNTAVDTEVHKGPQHLDRSTPRMED